jgi:hypothetical protein
MGNQARSVRFKCAILAFAIGILTAAPALADRDEDYALGVEAYNRGNFRIATNHLLSAMREGNSNAIVMLYLAHSYAAQGQYKLALPVYRNIRDSFKGTEEAAQAGECVVRLENPATFAARKPGQATATFYNRIKVQPNKLQPVGKETVTVVQSAITGMPRAIYQLLDSGMFNIVIAASAAEKFPGNAKIKGQAAGLVDKNICVFERSAPGAKTKFKASDLKDAFLREVGAALNTGSGGIYTDPDFHNAYQLDMRDMADGVEETMPFLAPPANRAEELVCNNIFSELAGSKAKMPLTVAKYFPKTRAWIINKFRLQS